MHNRQLDKKNLESFRQGGYPIKEDMSDEEIMTDSKTEKTFNNSTATEHRLVKNPTYTRITHASKQMGGIQPHFRVGTTMGGGRNGSQMNPLMKSMPNLEFLKLIDKNNTSGSIPFDEISGVENGL